MILSPRKVFGIRAVIFDLDDTLVAFDAVTEPSWRTVCGEFCSGKSSPDPETLYRAIRAAGDVYWSDPERHRIGRNRLAETRREIVKDTFITLGLIGPEHEADAVRLADTYTAVRTEAMYLFDGAREVLTAVRIRKLGTALMTNGESRIQREKIVRFGLGPFFDHILIEGELGYGKPDPRVYRTALERLGTAPEETMIVGDNPEWEIRVPQKQGFRTVYFNTRGIDPDTAGIVPDFRIAALPDLIQILEAVC